MYISGLRNIFFFLFSLLIWCAQPVYAQQIDSLVVSADTLIQTDASSPKAKQYLGVAIHVAMVGYGVASLGNRGRERIDLSTKGELAEDRTFLFERFPFVLEPSDLFRPRLNLFRK